MIRKWSAIRDRVLQHMWSQLIGYFSNLFSFQDSADQNQWQRNWELLGAMTEREIKARYKHSILGFLWIILNPLLQMIVIGSVFSFVIHVPIQNYFLFLFSGLLAWNFFSLTLLKVTPAIVFELGLIEKAKFPREIIVLAIVLSNLFHEVIATLLFSVLLLVIGKLQILHFFFIFIPLLWLTILVSGIGLLTSALNVRFRDVNFFVQALVPLWFYVTPVLYSISLLPRQFAFVAYVNPLSSCIEFFRWTLVGGDFPSFSLIFANLGMSLLLVLLGVVFFRREAQFFDDWA